MNLDILHLRDCIYCKYAVETLVSIKVSEIAYKGYLDKFKFGNLHAM